MHATRSPRAARSVCARILVGSSIALLGCSNVVLDRVNAEGPPVRGGALCGGTIEPSEPELTRVELRDPTSGTFISERLHLSAQLDGAETYVVLELDGDAVFVVAAPPALEGHAHLVPLAAGTYARLRPSGNVSDGASQVDIIDTSSPREPALVATHPVPGVVSAKWEGVVSAHEGLLYFCLQPDTGEGTGLAMLDLTAPKPGTLAYWSGSACADFFDGGFASGSLWLSWIIGDAIQVSQIVSYGLSSKGATEGVDWGYNPSGIHNYGVVKSAATDGTRIVLDPVSDAWFLLFTDTSTPWQGPYTSFSVPGPKRLLTVASQIAYFATPDGVHAYDVSDVGAPKLTDYHAEIDLDPALTTFLAASSDYLAIADGDGRLYLVPRDRSGKVAPATAYRGAREPDSTPASPCED